MRYYSKYRHRRTDPWRLEQRASTTQITLTFILDLSFACLSIITLLKLTCHKQFEHERLHFDDIITRCSTCLLIKHTHCTHIYRRDDVARHVAVIVTARHDVIGSLDRTAPPQRSLSPSLSSRLVSRRLKANCLDKWMLITSLRSVVIAPRRRRRFI